MDLTTLQLANAIGRAVLNGDPCAEPAQAVMQTLRQHGCWFCRLTEDTGATVSTPLPLVQPWLFDPEVK